VEKRSVTPGFKECGVRNRKLGKVWIASLNSELGEIENMIKGPYPLPFSKVKEQVLLTAFIPE
jgi:hypothetical protein